MPRKTKKTLFNFHTRKKCSSVENIEKNVTDQDHQSTFPCQETLSFPRTTCSAKQMCIEDATNIISEEKSFNPKLPRKKFHESDKQRGRCINILRKSGSKRLAKESTEKREQRLEDLRRRSKLNKKKQEFCLKVKTVDKINQEYILAKAQRNPISSHPHPKQKHSVTDISEFEECVIKEIVTLLKFQRKKLSVPKILDVTKQYLDGFNCSCSSMRKILQKLGYHFDTYYTCWKKDSTSSEDDENDKQDEIGTEKPQCTDLIAQMSQKYMGMLKPKEENKTIEDEKIEICIENIAT